MREQQFFCDDCQKWLPIPKHGISLGYGVDSNGKKVCFACCAKRDIAYMQNYDRITLYLTLDSENHYTVSNWPSSLVMRVTHSRVGKHNMTGQRLTVYFTAKDGSKWWGWHCGNGNQLVHCRRLKQ